jgi:hypothetical protein
VSVNASKVTLSIQLPSYLLSSDNKAQTHKDTNVDPKL